MEGQQNAIYSQQQLQQVTQPPLQQMQFQPQPVMMVPTDPTQPQQTIVYMEGQQPQQPQQLQPVIMVPMQIQQPQIVVVPTKPKQQSIESTEKVARKKNHLYQDTGTCDENLTCKGIACWWLLCCNMYCYCTEEDQDCIQSACCGDTSGCHGGGGGQAGLCALCLLPFFCCCGCCTACIRAYCLGMDNQHFCCCCTFKQTRIY